MAYAYECVICLLDLALFHLLFVTPCVCCYDDLGNVMHLLAMWKSHVTATGMSLEKLKVLKNHSSNK